jgi:hypothetical protein
MHNCRIYIAVHIKNPPPSYLVVKDPNTSWAFLDPTSAVGRLGSGSCYWAGLHPSLINNNWAARWVICHHHHMWATQAYRIRTTSCAIPIKYTHNTLWQKKFSEEHIKSRTRRPGGCNQSRGTSNTYVASTLKYLACVFTFNKANSQAS